METYNAKLISADFEESTMEFEIQHKFTVKAGDYVILHKSDYENLVSEADLKSGKLPIPHVSGSLLPLDVYNKTKELSAGEFIDWWFAQKQ